MTNVAITSVDAKHILTKCSEVEETVAILYRYFSRLHLGDKEISALFFKTALEEDEHANQFKLAYRLHGAGMKSIRTDQQSVDAILNKLKSLYETVQKKSPSVKEALNIAINVESSLSEYHMNSIVVFEDPSLSKLFTSMRKNDELHVEMLQEALESL